MQNDTTNREAAKQYLSKVAGEGPERARYLRMIALGIEAERAHAARKASTMVFESIVDVLYGSPPQENGSPFDPGEVREALQRTDLSNFVDTLSTLHDLVKELEATHGS